MQDELPDLPRVLHKREADVTTRILKWMRDNYTQSCAIEVKATTRDNIPTSALLPHQRLALMQARGQGMVHKLSDEARRRQPFDAFMLKRCNAMVICAFTKHRVAYAYMVEDFTGSHINDSIGDDSGLFLKIPL